MRLAEPLTALRAWCKQVSAWSVKTRHTPSPPCGDARDYGDKTTATHEMCALPYAMSAWSVKTRHDPSRHCRGARV